MRVMPATSETMPVMLDAAENAQTTSRPAKPCSAASSSSKSGPPVGPSAISMTSAPLSRHGNCSRYIRNPGFTVGRHPAPSQPNSISTGRTFPNPAAGARHESASEHGNFENRSSLACRHRKPAASPARPRHHRRSPRAQTAQPFPNSAAGTLREPASAPANSETCAIL